MMKSVFYENLIKYGAWLLLLSIWSCSQQATPTASDTGTATAETSNPAVENSYQIPVDYYTLDNGLKVVLSPDKTAPLVTVAVYYNIGFRIEPKDRTGFAHLFEHMMFQGSENLGKMEFIQLVQKNGGILNGSTRFDFTNYFEIVPAHKLETMLWAEADRMKGLNITQENLTNQQGVVKNEVKVNVLNQPYGGFPWLDMPQYANKNWYNAHNFYGDLEDLDAASLEDVKSFFDTFYSPNNAVVVVVGDFESEQAKAWMQQYFGSIPSGNLPEPANLTEPRQEKEQRFTKDDKLATRPALAFAYHMPERNSPEYYAMGLLDQILLQGNDSRLYQALVQERGYTGSVDGGINAFLGNMFNYNGPMLWMGSLIHDKDVAADSIVNVLDMEIQKLQQEGISQELMELAIVKMRSSLYDQLSQMSGFGRADLLASFALFDNDPARINQLEAEFRKVTPELLQKTIREYLRPTNRTVLLVNPQAKS
ncbi:insulinase family protein [Pontibacter sp. JH31]|uniref:Insulinase family protein n=1 Tax=Pontibacter aquaedesilientis TaxID=2766980 RepID=A0ABR7XEN7_9BACT|nr:pitrilysin family protein [Pontibacter aquaedesilientis]MBD1396376.1 insulinase family protein [Pontibacter aquaedesilientis]